MLDIFFKTKGFAVTNTKNYNATNTNTPLQTICNTCKNNDTSNKTVVYKPLKTMRHNDNLSQKMKQAAFIRRVQNDSMTTAESIQFRYRNL